MKAFLWACVVVLGIALLISALLFVSSIVLASALMSVSSRGNEWFGGLIMMLLAIFTVWFGILWGALLAIAIGKIEKLKRQ